MAPIFFTPGPSQIDSSIPTYIRTALQEGLLSISHRSKKFEEILSFTTNGLRTLLQIPTDYSIFFVSSGTEAMERIIENCVYRNSFHFVNGSFSNRFYLTAQELKKEPLKTEVAIGEGFNFTQITIPKSTELICFTHNETSTGVMIPLEQIYRFKTQYPHALFAVDIVSSVPLTQINIANFDAVFFSVQKGFGLPSGLGVLILSESAIEKAKSLHKRNINIGSYHNFLSLEKYAVNHQTPETPSTLHIYLLGKIIEKMITKDIEKIRINIHKRAQSIYTLLDDHPFISAFVSDHNVRSSTVIGINTKNYTYSLKRFLAEKNLIVGSGYGKLKETQIRIANFPASHDSAFKNLLMYLQKFPYNRIR